MDSIRRTFYGILRDLSSIGELASPPAPRNAIFEAVQAGDVDGARALFYEYDVDLAILNDDHMTALHLAILQGKNAMVSVLLEYTSPDSGVFEVVDREGYTPLMRATDRADVAMMIQMINAGARRAPCLPSQPNWHHLYPNPVDALAASKRAKNNREAADILSEENGDVTRAFQRAVQYSQGYAVDLFYSAQATRAALHFFISSQRWFSAEEQIQRGWIRDDDVAIVIEETLHCGIPARVKRLTEFLVQAVSWVSDQLLTPAALAHQRERVRMLLEAGLPAFLSILNIATAQNILEDAKLTAIRLIIDSVPANSNDLGEVFTSYISHVRAWSILEGPETFTTESLLFRAGVPAAEPLLKYARAVDPEKLTTLLSHSAPSLAFNALRELNNDATGLGGATLAFAMMRRTLKDNTLGLAQTIAQLRSVLATGDDAKTGADILSYAVWQGGEKDAMKKLMIAKGSASFVLVHMGRAGDRVEAMRVIRWGGDVAAAINKLLTNRQVHLLQGNAAKARQEQDAANVLAVAFAELAAPGVRTPSRPAKVKM
jgi:hypothetical protein